MTPEEEVEIEAEAAAARKRKSAAPLPEGTLPDSPLAKALASQTGDVVTVETPQGPGKFTRQGEPADVTPPADDPRARFGAQEQMLAALGGASHGIAPAMAGAAAAHRRLYSGNLTGLVDAYRKAHKSAEDTMTQAEAAHPLAKLTGEVLTTGPLAETLPARALTMLGLQGLGGAMRTEGDITQADTAPRMLKAADESMGEALPWIAGGEAVGALAGGAAKAIKAPIDAAAARVRDAKRAKIEELAQSELASLRGQLGGETQKGSRMLENAQRGVSGVTLGGNPGLPESLQNRALQTLGSPEANALQSGVLQQNLADLPGQMNKIQGLQSSVASKAAGLPAEVEKRTADYFAAPIMETEIGPRLERLRTRAMLAAGTSMASHLAGAGSAPAAGIGLGSFLAAPGTVSMLRNAAASPRLQEASLRGAGGLVDIAEGGAKLMSRSAPEMAAQDNRNAFDALSAYLGRPLKDKEDAASTHFVKGQMDHDYQSKFSGE